MRVGASSPAEGGRAAAGGSALDWSPAEWVRRHASDVTESLFGTVVGSAPFNLLCIPGGAALVVGGNLALRPWLMAREIFSLVVALLLFYCFIFDFVIIEMDILHVAIRLQCVCDLLAATISKVLLVAQRHLR